MTESQSPFLAGTIVARNYLAHARVLARSFSEHHPGQLLTVLLIDDPGRRTDATAEPFSVLHLDEIVDGDELSRLLMIYDVKELATAVKPLLLRWALSQGHTVAMYLDPDIEVFGSLLEIAAAAEQHQIVLTPHSLSPMPQDGRRPSEADILAAGVYNLGFLAVSDRVGEFLDWWWERLRRHCVVDPSRMLFVDQRWMDFVPAYFTHTVLQDPGANVAYWNLDSRKVSWNGERYEVDGGPLKFFHFSGFSPDSPWVLTEHFNSDRNLLSENSALRRLCDAYASKLLAAEYRSTIALPYGWATLPSGLQVTSGLRKMYRTALLAWEAGEDTSVPPAPFTPDGCSELMEWLNEPVVGQGRWQVSRYLLSIYQERSDLQAAYPDLASEDVENFFRWIISYGIAEHRIPPELIPPEAKDWPRLEASGDFGVNVVGYLRAELGVGEAGRLLVAGLSTAGVPNTTRAYGKTVSRQGHRFVENRPDEQPYAINIMCVNADQMNGFALSVGRQFFAGRYSIGLWFWEVEEFPSGMCKAFDHVDEVWVASDFVRETIAARTDKPVTTITLPVLPAPELDVNRERLGLPDRPVLLYMYDFMSVLERKNPLGLFEAFSKAFAPDEGPVLVLKSINGDKRRADLERVRFVASQRPDVIVRDGYVTPDDRLALIAASDGYVSLHRSEGFGLTLAEAMSVGTPTIATAYSGNMAFMSPSDSYLVDFEHVAIPKGCEPYPQTARWAEPNLEQAGEYMRRIVAEPSRAREMAQRAQHRILSDRSPQRAGESMRRRLEDIHGEHFPEDTLVEVAAVFSPPAGRGQLAAPVRKALEHARPWAGRLARAARTFRR